MNRKKVLVIYLLLMSLGVSAQSFNDCKHRLPICEFKTYNFDFLNGYGEIREEVNPSCSEKMSETNSVWMKWKVENPGILTFVLTPKNSTDDIDFLLFKSNGSGCNDLAELRCMATGLSYGDKKENYGKCYGATGLSINSMDLFERAGCKYNDDNFLKFLKVEAGEEYVLFVNNYKSDRGFNISFEGSCSLSTYNDCDKFLVPTFSVDIFPNPASQHLNMEVITEESSNLSYRIFDITGKKLLSKTLSPKDHQFVEKIDLDNLSSGVLILEVIQGSNSIIKQFIKN